MKSHVRSTKHQERQSKRHSMELQERDIAIALATYSKEVHNKWETLPMDMQVYRVNVVSAFLRAGIPLSELDLFRDILEENAYRLCNRRHMSDLIPFVLQQEQAKIKEEIEGQNVAIIFDDTTRLGEALAIVLRVISGEFQVIQHLVSLQLLQKSLTGEEIARELITVLSVCYGINPTLVLCAMRDGASTNNVAMRTLNVLYSNIFDVTCFSHTLDHVGNQFDMPVLLEFINGLVSLFSHSSKVKPYGRRRQAKQWPHIVQLGGGQSGRLWHKYSNTLEILSPSLLRILIFLQ